MKLIVKYSKSNSRKFGISGLVPLTNVGLDIEKGSSLLVSFRKYE
jgi:hypothetical protein